VRTLPWKAMFTGMLDAARRTESCGDEDEGGKRLIRHLVAPSCNTPMPRNYQLLAAPAGQAGTAEIAVAFLSPSFLSRPRPPRPTPWTKGLPHLLHMFSTTTDVSL